MSDLSGKKIAVDISIYLYKFVAENALLENMYLMLATFRYYGIVPVFIFDGKPPTEKKELLESRRQDKRDAENEFNRLKENLELDMEETERQEIQTSMDQLKKQFICIRRNQIQTVKDLIVAFGATYYDAPGEADELCAYLVNKKKVWGCLSEDTDMFVYGCANVLRYLSLMNHTMVLYKTKEILDELGVSQKEFREICVLSGTDYNVSKDSGNLYNVLKMFKKYHKVSSGKTDDFYSWLRENEYRYDYETLMEINEMFELSSEDFEDFEKKKISNGIYQKEQIRGILKEDGFIFV
jgi:flap endonuclease-1